MASPKRFKWLKRIGIFIGLLIAVLFLLYFINNESLPKGKTGAEADALAQKVLSAINKTAWDSTGAIMWTFADKHSFIWDKKRHLTQVRWEDKVALIDLQEVKGLAYQNGEPIADQIQNDELIKTAWSHWANDSFWLNAPAKVFDGGTSRSIVSLEDGSTGLMITYNSGGVTPGDSYLWILDENNLPKSYKMWVKIIPMGGVEATWEDWKPLSTGALISRSHKLGPLDIALTNVKGAKDLLELTEGKDIFAPITQ